MGVNTVKPETDRLIADLGTTTVELEKIHHKMERTEPGSPEHSQLLADLRNKLSCRDDILEKIYEQSQIYQRPNGRITGKFSQLLAPLPTNMKTIEVDEDTETIMDSLPSYRLPAILTMVGVIGGIIAMSMILPGLFISPLSLVIGMFSGDGVTTGTATYEPVAIFIATALATMIVIGVMKSRRGAIRLVRRAALNEEQWFRSGAENWTTRQRIVSCLAFGFCHVINIIYPLVTLLMLSAVGAIMMVIYLREYGRSHDTVRATLASTKFHTAYNIYVCGTLVLLVALLGIATSLLFIFP